MLCYLCGFVFVCLLNVRVCGVSDLLSDVVWLYCLCCCVFVCSCELECACVLFVSYCVVLHGCFVCGSLRDVA